MVFPLTVCTEPSGQFQFGVRSNTSLPWPVDRTRLSFGNVEHILFACPDIKTTTDEVDGMAWIVVTKSESLEKPVSTRWSMDASGRTFGDLEQSAYREVTTTTEEVDGMGRLSQGGSTPAMIRPAARSTFPPKTSSYNGPEKDGAVHMSENVITSAAKLSTRAKLREL